MANNGSVVRKNLHDLSKPIELRELNRQLDWMWKKILGGLTAKDFSDAGMKNIITTIEKTVAEEILTDKLETNVLVAALAEMMVAKIGVAKIDYAQIVDMFANSIFTDTGIAGKFRIDGLEVMQAQIVDLVVSSFRLVSQDGKVYKVSVDAEGNLHTEYLEDQEDWMQGGKVPDGYSAVASKLTVGDVTSGNLYVSGAADIMKLTAKVLTADQGFINELTSSNIFANHLMANEAFLDLLRTSKIVGDKSITMLAGEAEKANAKADELDRLSNIEVIEGTFAQAERREGEGIRIYSEIEPKQDLKWGAPWPGGGGKNLLNNTATTQTVNGVTFTVNADGTVTANGTATANAVLRIPCRLTVGETYTLSGCPAGGSTSTYFVQLGYFGNDTGSGVTATATVNTGSSVALLVMSGYTASNIVFKPQLELGSTATSFAPYANTPTIEGWTGLEAGHRGKNLCGSAEDIVVQNGPSKATMTQNGNVFTLSTTSEYGGDGFFFGYGVFKKGKKYTVSGTVAGYVNVRIYDKTNMNAWLHLITPDTNGNFALTFEATSDDVVFRVWVSVSAACTLSNFQIEEGDLTPYAPYQDNTYALDFGETVYGGTVDWHAGEMTVTREVLVLDGSENWANGYIANGKDNRFELTLRDKKYGDPSIASGSLNVLCNAFACQKTTGLPGVGKFRISQDYSVNNGLFMLFNPPTSLVPLENVSVWKAYLAQNPVQIELPLMEPYTIQLTPVQIETLQGINTVYTDADGGRVEFGHSPIDDLQNAVDALEEAAVESALYLQLDAENKVVRIGQVGETSEFHIDKAGAGVVVGGKTFSRFEGERVLIGDMEMRKPANIGGLAFDSIMT